MAKSDGAKRPLLPCSASQPAFVAGAGTVRLLSVNVWCHYFTALRSLVVPNLPGVLPMLPFGRRLDAIAELVESTGADIVCCEELFLLRLGPFVLEGAWARFAERMEAVGLIHRSDPRESLPWVFGQNSGLALFSRWPLNDIQSCAFSQSSEFFNRKGVIHALVTPPNFPRPLALCATHLDKRASAAKRAQFEQLGAVASARLATEQPGPRAEALVLCGDFNAQPAESTEWKSLVGALQQGDIKKDIKKQPPSAEAVGFRALNGWDSTSPAAAWPATHGQRTDDHVFLLTPLHSDGGQGRSPR
ncbi:Endonuclease/exonuclease/phosphatase [Pavlovales sp. CCMP2436]|nr:Endonuclease/exonuclease/phosphatase [Pavlovales sp. CCMP2436]